MKLEMTNEAGTGPDPDQWDGYPAERDAILEAFGDAGDVVVLSGDVHIGPATELPRDRHDDEAVAVEFVTTSLTSQNVDDKMGWEPRTGSVPMERTWVDAVPYVKFADFDDHGYVIVDVTPERVRAEWWFIDAVREPTTGQHLGAAWEVHRGESRLVPGG